MPTAAVVGSGPNGLVAAIRLAQAGLRVTVLEAAGRPGGGLRSGELTRPGLVHDECSAFHPMVPASPAFRALGLEREGLRLAWADVPLAHPLDGRRAGVLHRSLAETANGLGADGRAWRGVFGPLVEHVDALAAEILRPLPHVPRHPVVLARFGVRALPPATWLARRWVTDEGRALFAGLAGHLFERLTRPTGASVGVVLGALGHAHGWPVAVGGSQAIADALVARLSSLGGQVEAAVPVRSSRDLEATGPFDVVMFDTSPRAVVGIIGERMPARVAAAYRRYRYGPGAFKLDLAVEGGIPWTNEDCRRAGTVHVGGRLEEIVAAERDIAAGRMPVRPFVLVGQQSLADPGRAVGDVHPVWTYAHVPAGFTGDATGAIVDHLERFAPGLRDRIVGRFARGPAAMEAYNANYVGGDIGCGRNTPLRLVVRPRVAVNPYRTGVRGMYLCSAAAPPGAGVHGMGGWLAAATALSDLRRPSGR